MAKQKVKAKVKFSDIEAGFTNGLRLLASLSDSNLESVRLTRIIKFIDSQMEEPFAERTDWIAKWGTLNSKGKKEVRAENLNDKDRAEWLTKIKAWRARTIEVDFNSDHPTGKLKYQMFDSDANLLPQFVREALVDYVEFEDKKGDNPRDLKKKLEKLSQEFKELQKAAENRED